MSTYPSDLEIASAANKISIDKVAATIDITDEDLIKFGDDKAKISSSLIEKFVLSNSLVIQFIPLELTPITIKSGLFLSSSCSLSAFKKFIFFGRLQLKA